MTVTYKSNLLDDIRVGDEIASRGDRSIARISGKVTKINRVTLDLETEYFDKLMSLRIRRDDLRGEVRLLRDGQVFTTDAGRTQQPLKETG